MKLLLDVGNTRCKWAMIDGADRQVVGVFASKTFLSMEANPFTGVALTDVAEVVISCVAGAELVQSIALWFEKAIGVTPQVAKVIKSHMGVEVAYQHVQFFGVDRWLALLAARRQYAKACVVIDAGTTITIDYLDGQGRHGGGLIVPGVRMAHEALFKNTSAVKVESVDLPGSWSPGKDTASCVSNGHSAMLKGLLNEAVAKAGQDAKIFLTGGDSQLLESLCPDHVEVCEHLVLDGLSLL